LVPGSDPPKRTAPAPYPPVEPYDSGLLDVGGGHRVRWETCGNPGGRAALAVHGGPGSAASPWWRRLFDPAAYRIVLFDQRGCGRSLPHAGEDQTDLAANTTAHLVADMERLREHLRVDRWLLLGASWGSTLSLAYAVAHPERVRALVLFGVTTGRHAEFEWTFGGGLERFYPEQWERLAGALPAAGRGDVPAAYSRLLQDADPRVRGRAAYEWCLWESAISTWPPRTTLSSRFEDERHRLGFARLVTHYARHRAWLADGELLGRTSRIAAVPGVLVNGSLDLQAPPGNAWALKRAWPQAELHVVEAAGHAPGEAVESAVVAATDRFALRDD
jgi:proline iminopeptidase